MKAAASFFPIRNLLALRTGSRAVATLALVLAALAPLRADPYALTPIAKLELPSGHSYIISLGGLDHTDPTTGATRTRILLWTLDEAYETSVGATGFPDSGWTKVSSLKPLSRPQPESFVRFDPANQLQWFVSSFDQDDNPSLFTDLQTPPTVLAVTSFPGADNVPLDMDVSSDRSIFFLTSAKDIYRMTPSGGDLTLVVASHDPSVFSLDVAGDVIYTLGLVNVLDADGHPLKDINNQNITHGIMSRYSTSGDFLGQYTLANIVNPGEFVVNDRGLLFAMDPNSDHGNIYNAVTGGYLGHFDFQVGDSLPASDVNDPQSQGGKVSMAATDTTLLAISGSGRYFWSYDISGVSTVPEPASTAAAIGTGAVVLAALRRRRRR